MDLQYPQAVGQQPVARGPQSAYSPLYVCCLEFDVCEFDVCGQTTA